MRAILITGGATQNPIDSMRYITAYATGNTAIAIALQLQIFEPQLTLLCSPLGEYNAKSQGYTQKIHTFSSTRNLQKKMHDWLQKNPNGIVIHSAAVGDYEIANENNIHTKISSNQSELILKLQPAPKILSGLKLLAPQSKIISFKAASPDISYEQMIEIAKQQRQKSNSDIVFANQIGKTHQNIALIYPNTIQYISERELAIQQIVKNITDWMQEDNS